MSTTCSLDSSIDKATALRLLSSSQTRNTFVSLPNTSEEYQLIEKLLCQSLLWCKHTFRISSIELRQTLPTISREFKRFVESNGNIHLLFHGTKESNHESIFTCGFDLQKHRGDTDKGYIGKGVYLSPIPEYSASYIKETSGITHFQYVNPVDVGVTCKLLGCLAHVGRTRRLFSKDYNSDIESDLDSRWAWVQEDGYITDRSDIEFAVEYVVKESISALPAFRVSLQKITHEVIWIDPNIGNAENISYVCELRQSQIYLFATSSEQKALETLKKKREGTQYRAITSGNGGEVFVRKLRNEHSIMCKVMVFCMSVDYHKTWARKHDNVQVTKSPQTMKNFATWKD